MKNGAADSILRDVAPKSYLKLNGAPLGNIVCETLIGVNSNVLYMTSDSIGNGVVKRIMQKDGVATIRIFDASIMQLIDVPLNNVALA